MSDTPQKKPVRSNLPKLTGETIRAKTKSGDTPLHRAARKGQFALVPSHLFTVELFLVANSYGETPLHVAAKHGNLNQVPVEFLTHKTLTCRRSPPDSPDGTYLTASGEKAYTRTVLHVAACYQHIDQIPRKFLTLPYLQLVAGGFQKTLLQVIVEHEQQDLIPSVNSSKEIQRLIDRYKQIRNEELAADLAAEKEREAYIAKVRSEPITEKQKFKLKWFDSPVRKGMTKGEASDAITECIRLYPEKEKEYQNRPANEEQMIQLREYAKVDGDLALMFKEMQEEEHTLTYGEAKDLLQECEQEAVTRYFDGGQFQIDYLDNFVNSEDAREVLGYKKLNRNQLKELADYLKAHPEFENAGTYELAEIALQLFPGNLKASRDRLQQPGKRHKPISSLVTWVFFLTVCAFAYNRWSSTQSPSRDSKPSIVPPSTENSPTNPAPNALAKPFLTATPSPANPVVVADTKLRAVQRYPSLGVANSPLNTAFVARYKLYQVERPEFFSDPEWPMQLAKECADALQVR